MAAKTLETLFVDELRDAYDAEKQLVKALKKNAKAAEHPDLANAFTTHAEETQGQIALLEEIFGLLKLKPRGKHCAGIAGIIEEGGEQIEEIEKGIVLDSALCGGGKRAEHYEIAAYSTMVAMGKALGYADAVERLNTILSQEIATDKKFDGLAKTILAAAAREMADA